MTKIDLTTDESLELLHLVAISLALITGVIHVALGIARMPGPLGASFLLAGFGFFGAVVLFYAGFRRRLLYVVGIPYTAVQILLWIALVQPTGTGDVSIPAAVDKVVQVALIVVLAILYRRHS